MNRVNYRPEKKYILNLTTAQDALYFILIKVVEYDRMVMQSDGTVTLVYNSEEARDRDYEQASDIAWQQRCCICLKE